jgi:hypothetical protein
MPLSPQANAIVEDFGRQPGVLPEYEQNLRHAIDRSPVLMDEVNRAVKEGSLQHFELTPPDTNASGMYLSDTRTVQVQPSALANANPALGDQDDAARASRESLTNTMAHEVQHALNAKRIEQAQQTFEKDVEQVASSPQRDHDYTRAIGKMSHENMRDEASGQISGWNADVSAARKEFAGTKHTLTLEDIYQRNGSDAANFIDVGHREDGTKTYSLKPNLELNPDLSMPLSDRNVQGITKDLLSDPALGLGPRQNSNYPNYYGAGLVSEAVKAERAYAAGRPAGDRSEMSVNLTELGMNRKSLEENGLSLGVDRSPMPFVDKSTNPPTRSQFHDTRESFEYTPDPKKQGHDAMRLDNPSHPDHGLFQQARGHVHALDRQLGRAPDQHSDNLASAVTVSARADGLSRIDQVALSQDGSKLFAVQTPPGMRDHFFDKQTSVPTAAANTSMEQSASQWPQAMDKYQQHEQAQGQQQAQAQQQQQAQAQGQQQSAPVQQIGGR